MGLWTKNLICKLREFWCNWFKIDHVWWRWASIVLFKLKMKPIAQACEILSDMDIYLHEFYRYEVGMGCQEKCENNLGIELWFWTN